MSMLRRILTTVSITLGVIAGGVFWVLPVALSFDAPRKASPVTRVVPTDLKDLSVSQTPGTRVTYVGYEFEIPWTDLDESQTRSAPKDHPKMVVLVFRSGLHLIMSASPALVFSNAFAREWKVSPKNFDSVFGAGAAQRDYTFRKNLYQFTPDKMHLWALSPAVHYREQFLLTIKQTVLAGSSADTGIFNVQSRNLLGFQIGDPQSHPRNITVNLHSDDGSVELAFVGKDGWRPVGVTQPEINLIVASLRKVPQDRQGSTN